MRGNTPQCRSILAAEHRRGNDDVDSREWQTEALRRQMGIVSQHNFLFSGTVFTRGDSGFTVEQVPWQHEAGFRLPVTGSAATTETFND